MKNLQEVRNLIGKKIKQLRKANYLSQEELGFKIDSKASYICELEAGKRNPSIKKLWDIADVLGVEVREFFNED